MNNKLKEIKMKLNKTHIVSEKTEIQMYRKYKILVVNLPSIGCKYGKQGLCVMCPNEMRISKNLTITQIEDIWQSIEQQISELEVDKVLLSTYGNILSEDELSRDVLDYLLEKLNKIDKIRVVIFETYYKEITEEKIKYLNEKLSNKYIDFETGIESMDTEVQQKCLNKEVNLEELREKIKLIHKYDMAIEANVLVGIPFLTTKEQIEDVTNTIECLIKENVDEIVLFPVNIIKNSTIEFLYNNNVYKNISHWTVIKVLDNIREEFLNRISISMFGEYETSNKTCFKENIFPRTCDKCHNTIMHFYDEFLKIRDPKDRKKLITDLLNLNTDCDCKKEIE